MTGPRIHVSLRAAIEVWLWRHGWTWPVAAALLAGAVLVELGLGRAQDARIARAEAALELARAAAPSEASSEKPAATRADVATVLASAATTERVVAQMAKLATEQGLALPQGDYQRQVTNDRSIVQVQITQPVRGTYPQLRRYVEAVLRAVPNASLDQLSARRENVGQPALEAKLRWSLWLPAATPATKSSLPEQPTP